jgi:prepilin-type N-terminal cleavage/methylation domain-containing protein
MSKSHRKAFSLIELLAVIAIILILVGLLMPAFKYVRNAAARADSQAQLTVISIAVKKYATDFNGRYPGWFSNDDLADPTFQSEFTGNENLVASLVGRVLRNGESLPYDLGPPEVLGNLSDHPGNAAMSSGVWVTFRGAGPMDGHDLDLDAVKKREGPLENPLTVNDRIYHGAYYAPEQELLVPVTGTVGIDNIYPDILDRASGMPILYFRKEASAGANALPVTSDSPSTGMMNRMHNSDYFESANLTTPWDGDTYDMQNNSMLSVTVAGSAAVADANLAWLLGSEKFSMGPDPTLANEVGDTITTDFVLMAPGPDRVYFDREEVPNVIALSGYDSVGKFDDVIVRGGGG